MAIYHTRVKTFSRTQGHSSVAAAAYRAGLRLVDPRTGLRHDYRLRGGVVETRLVAPDDAPDWAFDPAQLWASAEAAERRKNATVAREFEIALPHELNGPQRSELVAALARALVDRYRFAVQASIHAPDTPDGLNWHAHILATTRRIGGEGLADKTRELDGGPAGRAEVEWTRAMVADTINRFLEDAKIDARVDHRTLEAQADAALTRGDLAAALALARQPTVHLGKDAVALERKGESTQLGERNAVIADENVQAFEDLLASCQADGRLMAVPEAHSAASARAERRRERGSAPTSVDGGEIRIARQTTSQSPDAPLPLADTETPSHLTSPAGRRRAAREAFREAVVLWEAAFDTPVASMLVYTASVMRRHGERLRTYIDQPLFAADIRELVRRLRTLVRDAGRLLRRKAKLVSAQAALTSAQRSLEDFDEKHTELALWSRALWAKRRSRRLSDVAKCAEAVQVARDATGETASRAYAAQTRSSADALEAWSATLLERYSLDTDQPTAGPQPPDQPMPPLPAPPPEGPKARSRRPSP